MQIQILLNSKLINVLTPGWKLYNNTVLFVLDTLNVLRLDEDGFNLYPHRILNSAGTLEQLSWFGNSGFTQEYTTNIRNFDIVSVYNPLTEGSGWYVSYNNSFYDMSTGIYAQAIDSTVTYNKFTNLEIGLRKLVAGEAETPADPPVFDGPS